MAIPKQWRIATIRGVDLKIHISLFILVAYLVLITIARFRYIVQGAGIKEEDLLLGPVVWGLVLSVGLFFSISLHELGHALFAKAHGVKVQGITLMMLGGISTMEKIPGPDQKPYFEFKLAVMGPLVSFALGALIFAGNNLTDSQDYRFFAYWLGNTNVILGIFNLLPAFPLDGGRALRSVLAARSGMIRATKTSVKVSQVFAWALGILGVLGFNIFLMLIAFFIYAAAQSELTFLLTQSLLRGLRAGELTLRVAPVAAVETLSEAASHMLRFKSMALPVIAADGSVGIITLDRIREVPREKWVYMKVAEIAETIPKCLEVDDQLNQMLMELASAPMGTLPVREHGAVVGVVRYADLSEILQLRSLEEKEVIVETPDQEVPQKVPKKRAA